MYISNYTEEFLLSLEYKLYKLKIQNKEENKELIDILNLIFKDLKLSKNDISKEFLRTLEKIKGYTKGLNYPIIKSIFDYFEERQKFKNTYKEIKNKFIKSFNLFKKKQINIDYLRFLIISLELYSKNKNNLYVNKSINLLTLLEELTQLNIQNYNFEEYFVSIYDNLIKSLENYKEDLNIQTKFLRFSNILEFVKKLLLEAVYVRKDYSLPICYKDIYFDYSNNNIRVKSKEDRQYLEIIKELDKYLNIIKADEETDFYSSYLELKEFENKHKDLF